MESSEDIHSCSKSASNSYGQSMLKLLDVSASDGSVISSLKQNLLKRSEVELHEKPEWRKRDIEALRNMVMTHKFLKACCSDAMLIRFLRARKFDYDRSLCLLCAYYSVRNQHPELFLDLTPKSLQTLLGTGIISPLLGLDYGGRRVFVFRAKVWQPELCSLDELIRLVLLIFEFEIAAEENQINGFSLVIDMQGVSIAFALQHLKAAYVRKLFVVFQDSFPGRLKAVHFINEPSLFSMLLSLLRPFVKEKLGQRLLAHGSGIETLLISVDLKLLPVFLGGPVCEWQNVAWIERILASQTYFERLSTFGFANSEAALAECQKTHINSGPLDGILSSYRTACISGPNAAE